MEDKIWEECARMAAEEVFEELRPGLTRVSYQILGSWADAEDIVQSTWLKWRRHHDSVESPRAWLTKVATRESIDGLRARQARRERYPGEWLPEPVSVSQDLRTSSPIAAHCRWASW
jgi:RNA polymerase sigma-70 factor (ECF subfamily)